MEKIIEDLNSGIEAGEAAGIGQSEPVQIVLAARRRLEECRALLERLANDEPAPEGHTFQTWARGLLA